MDKSINVGCEDRLAMDERQIYPRYMGFRPADGQVCERWRLMWSGYRCKRVWKM